MNLGLGSSVTDQYPVTSSSKSHLVERCVFNAKTEQIIEGKIMNAQTLAALKVGVILHSDDLKILIALSLRGPLTAGNLCEILGLKYAEIKQRTEELETRHLLTLVPIYLPGNAVRLGWNIAPPPGFAFALDALANNLDDETFTVKNAT